jgi:hypothetical protein
MLFMPNALVWLTNRCIPYLNGIPAFRHPAALLNPGRRCLPRPKQPNPMYTGLLHSHSYLAYLVLAGVFVSFIIALMGYLGNKPFTERDRKMGLLGLIPVHLQFVIGIVLYFVSPWGISNASGDAMKDSASRLYMLEHPLIMLLAVILITVGYSRAKRLTDNRARFRSIWLFYGIAMVLVLSRIPWFAWPGN